ncbi:hypothetical protein [Limnobacter sp.]|uniref:hypothetical protein n=1 Tax=Limnobacter sp. TaxID=2003368 RepID=UPI003515B376
MIVTQKISVALCLIACAGTIAAAELDADVLKRNMAYGDVIELNQYSPGGQKGLMLRLFSTPAHQESCGLETGAACKNQHLITVATFDEIPEVQVHTLGATGEFVKAKWIKTKGDESTPDQAELVLTFRQYNRVATRANPTLPKQTYRVGLKITQQGIEETLLTK